MATGQGRPGGMAHPNMAMHQAPQHQHMAMNQAQAQAQAQAAAQSMRKRAQVDGLLGAGIKGAKRGRPTSRVLPPSVTRSIPESALYSDLVRVEKALDWTVARKRAEVQDALGRTSKQKRTLRIFLSNTCANQPFQVEARKEAERKREEASKSGKKKKSEEGEEDDEGDDEVEGEAAEVAGEEKKEAVDTAAASKEATTSPEIPSWTLRVEGRLLEPTFRSRANAAQALQAAQARLSATRFSNLIKSIVVELVRDPSLYPAGENIVEWHKPTPTVAPPSASAPVGGDGAIPGTGNALDAPIIAVSEPSLDGFEVKRTGSIPVKARIVIYLAHTPDKYALSPDLAAILDIREETRQNVVASLWAYIKERKLLSEEDRRIVICDEALRGIFRTDRIAFHHIPEVVNRHLHPPAPIVLEYWIRTDKEEYKHPTAFDVEIELEDNGLRKVQDDVLAGFDTRGREIAELDDRIAQATQTLENRSTTRDFLQRFAQDPQGHIHSWMASQARDLDAILGRNYTTGGHLNLSTEELRRSETFNAPWVEQAVVVHEAQRVAEKMQTLQKGAASAPGMQGQPGMGGPAPMPGQAGSMRPR